MSIEGSQGQIADLINGDSWFSSAGLTARLSKQARSGTVDDLNSEVEADLRNDGIAIIVGVPRINSIGHAMHSRALLEIVVEVIIYENPTINRDDLSSGATGMKIVEETIKACLSLQELELSTEAFDASEAPSGTIGYIIRFSLRETLEGR